MSLIRDAKILETKSLALYSTALCFLQYLLYVHILHYSFAIIQALIIREKLCIELGDKKLMF